jgi:cysteine synthase B
MIYERITDLIGNTPLLRVPPSVHGLKNVDLFAKLEMMNPFGSVKDRIAWAMIEDDIEQIKAKGQTIFENSSGNTAKALQAIAGTYGVKTKLVTSLAKVQTVKDIIMMMGAEIEEIMGGSECFDPNDPNDPQYLIAKMVKEEPDKVYFPSQFTNPKNPDVHYRTTGKEIADDVGCVDFFFGGLGTSGSTLGAAKRLREEGSPDLITVGAFATKNDYLPGVRSLEQMWESGLFEKDNYDEFLHVDSGESIDAMMELVRKVGILCGPTSGASYLAALKYLRNVDDQLSERKTAVFIVCDRIEWYVEYIRQRRPQLFGQAVKTGSLRAFSPSSINDSLVVPVASAQEWISENDPLIIDVRGNLAYKMATVPGAINIPLELFEAMIDAAEPFPKDQIILLVCQVGEKTNRYAAYLQARNYKAWSLDGGIVGWRDANNKLTKFEAEYALRR